MRCDLLEYAFATVSLIVRLSKPMFMISISSFGSFFKKSLIISTVAFLTETRSYLSLETDKVYGL